MTKIFVDRRRNDRRLEQDRCKELPVDLFHRKRRKSSERRAGGRDLTDDYFAYVENVAQNNDDTPCIMPNEMGRDDDNKTKRVLN